MRLKGTGKDPDQKYPDGLVFDAPPHAAQKLADAGYATVLDPQDDPGRTESQIAGAVQRGDSLNDPVDAALAGDVSTSEALETVHGTSVDAPVDGGPSAKAPPGVGPEALPGDGGATSEEEDLTPKQALVEQAKALDISHSGSAADLEERIAVRKEEIAQVEQAAAEATAGDGGEGASA